MALPGFICIGAQKAGTTWLYEMLSQNPSIWLPPLKEVHYFDTLDPSDAEKHAKREKILKLARRARKGRSKGSTASDGGVFLTSLASDDILSEAWYRRIFAHPESEGRISGEITPAYLVLEEARVAYVKSLLPDARIVILVREPRARIISEIRMAAERSKLTELADSDWQRIFAGIKKRGRGNYADAIPRWQKHYDPGQLLILPFSQLRTDPAGMLQTIETFIGAAPFQYEALTEQIHQTKAVEIPDWLMERATRLTEPHMKYLIEVFGEAFYQQTR